MKTNRMEEFGLALRESMRQAEDRPNGEGAEPMFRISDLVVRRGASTVLRIDSLEVWPGEVLAVIGPNGAGKSTLLSVLAFLHAPASGQVWFGGRKVGRGDNLVALRRRMAVVFQEPLLLDTSVHDNVASGLRIRGISGEEAEARTHHWMKRFGVEILARRQARQLSGW